MQEIKERKILLASIPCHICSVLILTKTGKHRQGKTATRQGKNKPALPNSVLACIHLRDQVPLTQPDGQTKQPAFVIYANKGETRAGEYFTMTGSPLGCLNIGVQHQHFLLRRCHRG